MAGDTRGPGLLRYAADKFARDVANVRRHGRNAPRYAQRIWIDPRECHTSTDVFERDASGMIVGGDWGGSVLPIDDARDMRACREHWERGRSWEETGVYTFLLQEIEEHGGEKDGCRSLEDVRARYDALDRLYEQARREGRLRTQAELRRVGFRERRGVLVHVGADGLPVFGRHGCHRMAVARILGLPTMPAQVGVVHPNALERWGEFVRPPAPTQYLGRRR